MRFKIGDGVKVRTDLTPHKYYGGYPHTVNEDEFLGKTAVIKSDNERGYKCDVYTLTFDDGSRCHCVWTDEMLLPFSHCEKLKKLRDKLYAPLLKK